MKKLIYFSCSIVLLSTILLFNSCCPDSGYTIENQTINRSVWFRPVDDILNSVEVRLNNYTSTRDESDPVFAFLVRGDSHIAIEGSTFPIVLDDPMLLRFEPYTIYINDINSESVSSTVNTGGIYLTINMESEGTEIITDCIDNAICVEKPQAEINEATVMLRFIPTVEEGVVNVNMLVGFSAETNINICNDNFFAFICDLSGFGDETLNELILQRLRFSINSTPIRARVTEILRSLIESNLDPDEELLGINFSSLGDLILVKKVSCGG